MIEPIDVNGVMIYPFRSPEELIDFALEQKKILIATRAGKILGADDNFREMVRQNIAYADGVGASLPLRKLGAKDAARIPGCELWLKIVERTYKTKSLYLIGGKEETIQQTIAKLKEDFTGINILGYHNGYFESTDQQNTVIKDVIEKAPDIIFIAMGSPKQELLMMKMQKLHQALYQGLGGSFDVYVGNVKRAPKIFCKLGLEGVYRTLKQPSRLDRWKTNLKFIKFYLTLKR